MKTGNTDESPSGQGYILATTKVVPKQGGVELKPLIISPPTL